MDCGGKGAADDTALDFPGRENILARSTNQSGVDACALPPHSIWGRILECGGRGVAVDTALDLSERVGTQELDGSVWAGGLVDAQELGASIWAGGRNQSGVALRELVLASLPAALQKARGIP